MLVMNPIRASKIPVLPPDCSLPASRKFIGSVFLVADLVTLGLKPQTLQEDVPYNRHCPDFLLPYAHNNLWQ